MVGEGHAFDMIRRIKEGREASRLRRERANDKLKHLNRANEPYYHGSPDSNCHHTLGCIYQINNNKFLFIRLVSPVL